MRRDGGFQPCLGVVFDVRGNRTPQRLTLLGTSGGLFQSAPKSCLNREKCARYVVFNMEFSDVRAKLNNDLGVVRNLRTRGNQEMLRWLTLPLHPNTSQGRLKTALRLCSKVIDTFTI